MILGSIKINAVPDVRVLRTWINTSVADKKLSVKTLHRERFGATCTLM
jgi:hypothetical protein